MAGHNIVNPRYALISTAHSYTLIKEGPRMRNTETVRLFPVRVIGEADILLLLQSGNNRFLIYCIRLGELYAIDWLITLRVIGEPQPPGKPRRNQRGSAQPKRRP